MMYMLYHGTSTLDPRHGDSSSEMVLLGLPQLGDESLLPDPNSM
jgi:hypothetical protein